MEIRAVAMSPDREALLRNSTRSLAWMSPSTRPCRITLRASMLARTRPFGPTVKVCPRSAMEPSTSPSTIRSSLPESSPLTTTDLPMVATSLLTHRFTARRFRPATAVRWGPVPAARAGNVGLRSWVLVFLTLPHVCELRQAGGNHRPAGSAPHLHLCVCNRCEEDTQPQAAPQTFSERNRNDDFRVSSSAVTP